jgi:hypothetical protein
LSEIVLAHLSQIVRRLLLSYVLMAAGVAVSCSSEGTATTTKLIKPAVSDANLQYGSITSLPDGAKTQVISLEGGDGGREAVEVIVYPTSGHRSAADWIINKWDSKHLLVLAPCHTSLGDCTIVADSTAFRQQADPTIQDFPELAVIVSGDQALVIDRVNGVQSNDQHILRALGIAA